jgi:hypothetical protein
MLEIYAKSGLKIALFLLSVFAVFVSFVLCFDLVLKETALTGFFKENFYQNKTILVVFATSCLIHLVGIVFFVFKKNSIKKSLSIFFTFNCFYLIFLICSAYVMHRNECVFFKTNYCDWEREDALIASDGIDTTGSIFSWIHNSDFAFLFFIGWFLLSCFVGFGLFRVIDQKFKTGFDSLSLYQKLIFSFFLSGFVMCLFGFLLGFLSTSGLIEIPKWR